MISDWELEKIYQDTKRWCLLFEKGSEKEIMEYCFTNEWLYPKEYAHLFETACLYNNHKVVKNFLTKEYTEDSPKTSIDLYFLYQSDAINFCIEKENFEIIDIIFEHLEDRRKHPLSKISSFRKKTEKYFYEIFKKSIKKGNKWLFDHKYNSYEKLSDEYKIELIKYEFTEIFGKRNNDIFAFLINDNKNSVLFKLNFDYFFDHLLMKERMEKFDVFINLTNFSLENNFDYYLSKCLNYWNRKERINYLLSHQYFIDNFTYHHLLEYIEKFKHEDVNFIIKLFSLKNIQSHITSNFIKSYIQDKNVQNKLIESIKINQF